MICRKAQNQLDAFIDGTLDIVRYEAVQCHLATCPRCQEELYQQRSTENQLRAAFQDETVPDILWQRIQVNIERLELSEPIKLRFRHRAAWVWPSVAAVILILAMGTVWLKSPRLPTFVPTPVVSIPVQDMHTFVASQRTLDVPSPKPQHVRQWFQERVNFALPRLPGRAGSARLVGGRLCHFFGRRVAAYMYDAHGYDVSLYVMSRQNLVLPPGKPLGLEPIQATVYELKGYTHILWFQIDLLYSLVSDLPRDQLADMAKTLALTGQTNPPYFSL